MLTASKGILATPEGAGKLSLPGNFQNLSCRLKKTLADSWTGNDALEADGIISLFKNDAPCDVFFLNQKKTPVTVRVGLEL